MSNPRRQPFGYDCPNSNNQTPASRQQPQRLRDSQQRPIPRRPVAPTRLTRSAPPSSSRPQPQQPASTRNVRIATFSDLGGLGGEREEQGPGYLMGGQGDEAVGDRGIGDFRRWVPAELYGEPAQPVGSFSGTGRTLDGRTVTSQVVQESYTPLERGIGLGIRRPGGRSENDAATQQGQNVSNGIRRAAGAPSTGLDTQRTTTGPFCTVTLGCGRNCPGTWSQNGEPFNHVGSAVASHFIAGTLILFSNSPNAFSVRFTIGLRESDFGNTTDLRDLTDRQLLILRAVCMRRCLKRDLQNRQCHPHMQKFHDEGWLSSGAAGHFDKMMNGKLKMVNTILGFPREEWVGTQPDMVIPDPMKVDARLRTMRRGNRPDLFGFGGLSLMNNPVAFPEGRSKGFRRNSPYPEDRYHQVDYTP